MEQGKSFTVKGVTFRLFNVVLAVTVLCLAIVSISLTAYVAGQKGSTNPEADSCHSDACLESAAVTMALMNRSVDPCNDFYQYACGSFARFQKIDPAQSEKTVYSMVYNENIQKLRRLMDVPAGRTTKFAYQRKLHDLWKSCNDDYAKEVDHAEPLFNILDRGAAGWYVISTWKDKEILDDAFTFGTWDYMTPLLFTARVAPNAYDTTQRVITVDLGGLGMYWWYYLQDNYRPTVEAYKDFMRKVAKLLVRDAPKANITLPADVDQRIETFVDDVMYIENQLATITAYTLPSDDPHAYENQVTMAELSQSANILNWQQFFGYMFPHINSYTRVVLLEKDYLHKVSDMVKSIGEFRDRKLNNYLVWRLTSGIVQDLSWDYVHANREFYVAMTGRAEFLGTWNYCFNFLSAEMPEALGALFINDHFADDAKVSAHKLVENLKGAMTDRLESLPWMEEKSKQAAYLKMRANHDKLGYPDWFADTSKVDDYFAELEVPSDRDFFTNVLQLHLFKRGKLRKLLKEGEDRTEWQLHAYDTHGQFYQYWNELLFPAGMLQFPYYNKNLPSWMNYGSIGTIIGHELIHGFDEFGGYYTDKGEVADWWTEATTHNYVIRRECVVKAYNTTVGPYVIPGQTGKHFVRVDSRRYAFEAIANEGGVRIAYNAYKARSAKEGRELKPPGIDKSAEQSFFIAFAQSNCFLRTDRASFDKIQAGGVPESLKVNGALSQMQEFQSAFNCPASSRMNAPQKCNIF